MTLFKEAIGRSVIGRSDAEPVGTISRFVVDAGAHKVVGLVVGSGRKAAAYRWEQVTGFGPDAVLVEGEALGGDEAKDAGSGRADPLGKRLLTVLGEEVGAVDDVEFDSESAEVRTLHSAQGGHLPASLLRGVGSYAVVIDTPS